MSISFSSPQHRPSVAVDSVLFESLAWLSRRSMTLCARESTRITHRCPFDREAELQTGRTGSHRVGEAELDRRANEITRQL